MKLDFTIESPEERLKVVEQIIADSPPDTLTPTQLESLADYLVLCMEKKEKKQKHILTDNRMVTVNKWETSYEGLAGKLENGEDGIFNMITNDKNIILSPAVSINEADVAEIPGLRELRDAIEDVKKQLETAHGRRAFLLKKTIIQMYQDQYILKNMFRRPIYFMKTFKSINNLVIDESIHINKKGKVESDGYLNLYTPAHVSLLLCNYSKLKEECYTDFNSDMHWILHDLEYYTDIALKEQYPLYYDLLIYKIDGKSNQEIQDLLEQKYGIKNTPEYLSSLWRNKIPKIIAETACKEWLTWYYTTQIRGEWKRCSQCHIVKPAHKYFFNKNKTSKDGFYSICKDCRNKSGKNNIGREVKKIERKDS